MSKTVEDNLSGRPPVGRFAPSPSGRMHAGNIFAALMAWLIVKLQGGTVVLRIEDLDRERSKPQFIDAIQRDFELLGLTWDKGPFFQSTRFEAYESAFQTLQANGLVYPCYCTRADLHAASAPHRGEKLVYPGTCRNLTDRQRQEKAAHRQPAMRLRVPSETITIDDMIQGRFTQTLDADCGDFLVKRSDGAFAYQLAVVVDDADEGIDSVVRGCDLLTSTPQQVYLQRILGVRQPCYAHIPLLVAEWGRRLSKRNHDASLEALLQCYGTSKGVIGHIAYVVGIIEEDAPVSPEDLLGVCTLESLSSMFSGKIQIQWH